MAEQESLAKSREEDSARVTRNVKGAISLVLDGAMRSVDDDRAGDLNGFAIACIILKVLDDWDLFREPAQQMLDKDD